MLHPDRLFPSETRERDIARRLYAEVSDAPIVSPHGHTDPSWFSENQPFPDPAQLLIVPDHYVLRMLFSQGLSLESLGVRPHDGGAYETDGRKIFHLFAEHYHLFRGTPSQIWIDWVLQEAFGIQEELTAQSSSRIYDHMSEALLSPSFAPRALFERFQIETLATTEGALDDLEHHRKLRQSDWGGRVITTYRPDSVTDPDHPDFLEGVRELGELTGHDTRDWSGYLQAHRARRDFFKNEGGAAATDHGVPSAATADLSQAECQALFSRVLSAEHEPGDAELFRAQMLTEMARMSLDDGLTIQIHAGCYRNHNEMVMKRFGRDMGADIPVQGEFVHGLRPLLNAVGNEPGLNIIIFTLDEDVYARELAPLAGHYPALLLGPPWWFHDSPEGMRRFRERTTETAGFYNTAGFNDDTRAFLSIPARHDVARRMDAAWLAKLVAEHRLSEAAAVELMGELAYGLAKRAYKL